MTSSIPPIVTAAERLLVDIEQAVKGFARYHKYSIGTELRQNAMAISLRAIAMWRDRAHQAHHVSVLVREVDALKQRMQLCVLLKAYSSFRQFEALLKAAAELGRQVGGLHKQLNPKAQNHPSSVAGERGKTLSTRAASQGAYP